MAKEKYQQIYGTPPASVIRLALVQNPLTFSDSTTVLPQSDRAMIVHVASDGRVNSTKGVISVSDGMMTSTAACLNFQYFSLAEDGTVHHIIDCQLTNNETGFRIWPLWQTRTAFDASEPRDFHGEFTTEIGTTGTTGPTHDQSVKSFNYIPVPEAGGSSFNNQAGGSFITFDSGETYVAIVAEATDANVKHDLYGEDIVDWSLVDNSIVSTTSTDTSATFTLNQNILGENFPLTTTEWKKEFNLSVYAKTFGGRIYPLYNSDLLATPFSFTTKQGTVKIPNFLGSGLFELVTNLTDKSNGALVQSTYTHYKVEGVRFGAGFDPSESIVVDFGSSSYQSGGNLVDLYQGGSTIQSNVLTTTGEGVTVDVAITKAFSLGAKTNGSTTGDGKFFKGNVSRDYLLAGSATSHADALTKPGQVTITGLTASALYTLEMYGSAVQSGTSSEFSTNYKAGGKTVTYLPLNNSVGVANLVGVMSDSTGKIVLDVAVTPNGTAKYAVLGGLRIVRE